MWQRRTKTNSGTNVIALVLIFFIPSLLAVLAPIIQRASLLLANSCSGGSTSHIPPIAYQDLWPVLLTWIPALLFIPFILNPFSEGLSAKTVCIIFVCTCHAWIIVSIFISWLLHTFVASNIDIEYIGFVHAGLNTALVCGVALIASLGWFRKTAYDFMAGLALFGAYSGFMFFFAVETFFGTAKLNDVPLAMGKSTLFMVYSIASSLWFAIIVARIRLGFSSRWSYIWGCLWSVALSLGVSLYIEYPITGFKSWIPVIAVRYACFILTGVVGIGMSLVAARPVMRSKDQIKDDSNMQYALSLMTRNEKASSSLMSSPPLKPMALT